MKILLVRHHSIAGINTRLPASLNKAQGIYPPLGIAYIAAVLEKNHDVKILDSQAENLTVGEVSKRIKHASPDVVGVTAMTPSIHGALEACRLAKEVDESIVTIMGGVHLSIYPFETVKSPWVDYGLIGEGEYAMVEFLEMLQDERKIKDVKGLVYNNKINPQREAITNLDALPFPARHLLPMKKYQCVIMKYPMTTLITARGCPFNCHFCFKDAYLNRYRMRSPKNVVEEMEKCVDKYHVKEIAFYDDCFPNKMHLRGICNEIINRGLDISWETPQRVDLVDFDLLKLMKRAGCIRVRYGIESGNNRILKFMNKGITLDQARHAFKWTKEIGMETFAYFMIGYPTETPATIDDTIKFAKELNPDWAMFTVTMPLPNTPLMHYVIENNLLNENYWLLNMHGKKERMPHFIFGADKFCEKAYKQYYLRYGYLLKKLSRVRSWGQLIRYVRGAMALLRFKMVS